MKDRATGSPGSELPGGPPSPDTSENPQGGNRRIGELLFAAGTVALGGYALIGAAAVRLPGSTNSLGPQAFPYLVGGMLVVSGLVVGTQELRGRFGDPESGEDIDPGAGTDWFTVAKLVGFFVAHTLLIGFIGWPIAAGVLFAGLLGRSAPSDGFSPR